MLTTDIEDGPRGPSSKHSLGMRRPVRVRQFWPIRQAFDVMVLFLACPTCHGDDEFSARFCFTLLPTRRLECDICCC